MDRLIANLPRDLAETLRLSMTGDLTSVKVGEILGIPDRTVRTRLLIAYVATTPIDEMKNHLGFLDAPAEGKEETKENR